MENFDTIQASPAQIYHSALPLCPSSTWLQEYYGRGLSQGVKVIRGIPAEWGTCFHTVKVGVDLPMVLSHRNNTVAVGLFKGNIIILDVTTGSQAAVLCGHSGVILCLSFSLDGKLLVSGSQDKTVRLWDVQTGGNIRTFCGHEHAVQSVSISVDCTHIASGMHDMLYLWDVQTGKWLFGESGLDQPHVNFSPVNPQHLIYTSHDTIYQLDTFRLQIEVICNPFTNVLAIHYPMFAGCKEKDVIVQNLESGATVAEFHTSWISPKYCCFSPDSKLVAASSETSTEVWNIVGSSPYLIKMLSSDDGIIAFITPSSLISTFVHDQSIKFWKIGVLLGKVTLPDPKPATLASASIASISLQGRNRIAITSNSAGLVEIWDLSTGCFKSSFQSPAYGNHRGDAKLIDGGLIFAWTTGGVSYVWESGNSRTSEVSRQEFGCDLLVSGDGSKVFWLDFSANAIKVWSVLARELVGEVGLMRGDRIDLFHADGSKIWIQSQDLSTKGWDFGVLGSPTPLSNTPSERPNLNVVYSHMAFSTWWIEDMVTGKEVFRPSGRHANIEVSKTKWDGQYLIAGCGNGEVLILDFGHVYFQ